MKLSGTIILIIVIQMVLCSPVLSSNSGTDYKEKRWDTEMIDESHIWSKLLTNYAYAEHQKYWPNRKEALENIVINYPNSQWADDAELILVCGKFEFEGKHGLDDLKSNENAYAQGYFGNAEEAINGLRNIIHKYPNGKSIISPWWLVGSGCKFNQTWLQSRGSLVSLNPDGSIRKSRPFDRDSKISQKEKEVLAYFEHLDRNPILTKDIARLFIAEILMHQGKFEEAVLEMKKNISNIDSLEITLQADNSATYGLDGFQIRSLFRPEYKAMISLIDIYEKQEAPKKVINLLDVFAPVVDYGPNFKMNERFGNSYVKYGLHSKAKSQYQTALEKVESYIAADKIRSKSLDYIKQPTDEELSPFLKREAALLKQKIR